MSKDWDSAEDTARTRPPLQHHQSVPRAGVRVCSVHPKLRAGGVYNTQSVSRRPSRCCTSERSSPRSASMATSRSSGCLGGHPRTSTRVTAIHAPCHTRFLLPGVRFLGRCHFCWRCNRVLYSAKITPPLDRDSSGNVVLNLTCFIVCKGTYINKLIVLWTQPRIIAENISARFRNHYFRAVMRQDQVRSHAYLGARTAFPCMFTGELCSQHVST